MDVNLNNAECLRTITHIGHDSIRNVCTGAVTDLVWGAGTWFGAVGIAGLFLILALALLMLIAMMARDIMGL